MRIGIIGDIGGQLATFEETLQRFGVTDNYSIPTDLTIIQIGDVFRASDDERLDVTGTMLLADKMLQNNPTNYIQLFGNHESPMIGAATPPTWATRDIMQDKTSREIIGRWWNEKQGKMAAVITEENGIQTLVSHAGITSDYMNIIAPTPRGITKKLNGLVGETKTYQQYVRTGVISFFHPFNRGADNLWASASEELYPSWAGKKMGFNQVHGHDTVLLSWEDMRERKVLAAQDYTIDIEAEKRLTTITNNYGETFKTCDWVLKETEHPDSKNYGLLEYAGQLFV